MDPSQPILRRSRRIRARNTGIDCFAELRAENTRATTSASLGGRVTESVSTPQEHSKAIKSSSQSILESITSESSCHANGDYDRGDLAGISAPQMPDRDGLGPSISQDTMTALDPEHFGSAVLEPTAHIDSPRRRHNPITYKRRRSMRIRPTPIRECTQSSLAPQSQQSTNAPASTPSCSPLPPQASTRARKRRRRLPPLKNRLARVARARLTRQRSPEDHSQSPAPPVLPEPAETEADEEFKPDIVEPNVTQRRLAAPENYTIPDLKDFLNSRSRAPEKPARLSVKVAPHDPTPRFVLPQRNTIHASRLVHESKSPRARRKGDTPRLNFVALEAHHKQATMRSSDKQASGILGSRRSPFTQQVSPSRKSVFFKSSEPDEIPCPIENDSNSPVRSTGRVLVKDTPEDTPTPSKFSKTDRVDTPFKAKISNTNIATTPFVQSNHSPSRSMPISELYDSLLKLAKSAQQMGKPVLTGALGSPSLKRKHQTTLTPQLTYEVTQPVKAPRLH